MSPPAPPVGRPRPRIVSVDDDPEARALARAALGERFEILEVEGGARALEIVAAEPVDGVLLDVEMPGMDGIAVLGELVARHPGLPVVMLTGVTSIDVGVLCMKLGAAEYVTKPFAPATLLDAVSSALARAQRVGGAGGSGEPLPVLVLDAELGRRAVLHALLRDLEGVRLMESAAELTSPGPSARARGCVILTFADPANAAALPAIRAWWPGARILVARVGGVAVSGLEDAELLDGQIGEVARLVAGLRARSTGAWDALSRYVMPALDHIARALAEQLDADVLARIMRVSRRHIDRLFELELREPPMTFVRRVRIEAAIDLRMRTGDKLESIAQRTGFADAPSLSHACQRLHGRALGALAEDRLASLGRRLA